MNHDVDDRLDRRILVLTLTARDAALTTSLLTSAGIDVEITPTCDALIMELERGAAAILIPEEMISSSARGRLQGIMARQPTWSDLPVFVLTRPGADSAASGDAVRTLGNVTLLERPLQVSTLLSAVRTALRARARQYQIRGHLAERARAEEALHVADRRKDEFLATLGHELRNPLAPLLSGIEILKSLPPRHADVTRVTAIMERQLMHLVRLVDDLLEVSRITRGLVQIERKPLDVASVVRSAVETTRPILDAAGHDLHMTVPPEPVAIDGDAVRLTQVFANLLTNAAKYTDPGGHIWLTVRREGDRAVVSVRDDGIGIAEAQLAAVFDMFTQVDRSDRRAQGGLGIGLTLVRSLLAMHDGRVEARSAGPGRGSEFVVELPARADAIGSPEAPAALREFPLRRILVVDDNGDAADTLASHLEALGAIVSVINSGQGAIDRLAGFQPDTVLLDIGMPGMNGYEVARRIRAVPGYEETLLIALTGWGQAEDYRQSRAAGIDHHMVKPLDMHRLRRLLVGNVPAATSGRSGRVGSTSRPGSVT